VKAARTGPNAFTVEFESEDELREEHRANLTQGGIRLPVADRPALFSPANVTLRGPSGCEARVKGTVVAPLPDGVALHFEGDADALLAALLAAPADPESPGKSVSDWDRLRAMSRTQKLLYAPKAERNDRLVLVQDADPQVLYALLKNPRLTVDEVIRVAKSAYLTYQTAELILKTTQWAANVEVRTALVHNPKTPSAFALRILPSLPEAEVKAIARGAATSMALKQAALKRLQGGA
jgi:hypothetical protein